MRTLVWFRGKDLRVDDHAPLRAAIERATEEAGEVVPLFVLDPYFFAPERARELPHRMQFLLDGLRELDARLTKLGSRLLLVTGKSVEVVPRLARELRVRRVVAHRWSEPFGRERDRRIEEAVERDGIHFELLEGETLAAPGMVRNGSGDAYRVFTPFMKAFVAQVQVPRCIPAPKSLPPLPSSLFGSISSPMVDQVPRFEELGLAPNPRIQKGGESLGAERLASFLRRAASRYAEDRDRMDRPGTSRLSADLKFGTLSVRRVWNALHDADLPTSARESFRNELLWREFAHDLLRERPELLQRPFRLEFEGYPFGNDAARFARWTEGTTGYPVVDAAQRQLLQEGFVHNRARMITASFLTKHLDVDYRWGEAHFMKWLTDGDWAQNNAGWQWSMGCGCDAQPYFRVFNPVSQGERFDPEGEYVRRWVPELGRLPAKWIHAPWTAPADVLRAAGVALARTYPRPIVDHAVARAAFLDKANTFLGRKSSTTAAKLPF